MAHYHLRLVPALLATMDLAYEVPPPRNELRGTKRAAGAVYAALADPHEGENEDRVSRASASAT